MTLYEKNMQELENKYPVIYDAIKAVGTDDISDIVRIEDARKGGQVVVYHDNGNDAYLNSKYDPENEAFKYMEDTFEMQDGALLIMYGFSNGYYVREHIKHAKNNTRCIVFEPSKAVFLQVLSNIDISELIKSDRVFFIVKDVNTEDFSAIAGEWLDMANKDANKIMVAPKYTDLFRDGYEDFKQNCIDMYEKLHVIANIAEEYGEKEVKNEIHNMKYLAGCRLGTELKGMFPDDMTAIIVSAGPSLQKNVELLREAKGKALIFVVDSAIPKVMEQGIKPDAIISIDCIKGIESFDFDGISEVPFFAHTNSNIEVFNFVNPQNLFFFSSDSAVWSSLFKKLGKDIPAMNMGGSVATAAMANLISWGIKRIILIGQDLSLTDNRVHVGEDAIEINEENNQYKVVKDINGDDVITRKDFYYIQKWMEEAALHHSDIEFIDATEGGALKKNFINMTFREVIDKYCKKEYDVEKIMLSVSRMFEGEERQFIIDALEKMKIDFGNMRRQLLNCKTDCIRLKKLIESGAGNVKELKRINNNIVKTVSMIKNSDESTCIYKWTAEAEFNMLKKDADGRNSEESAIAQCDRNVKYFEELADAMPKLMVIVEECLLKLEL
ncbi:MAG: motility associated factor glycosyltransferase family protein [Lachnospiraceae bacterium]|nr:motility associated factor glycosyltransferase family protein [Lachnospiraceae bacterium]